MKTIHVAETAEDRKLVLAVFEKACEAVKEGCDHRKHSWFPGDVAYKLDDVDEILPPDYVKEGAGAVVILREGDGCWTVIDFGTLKVKKVVDGAASFNILNGVFPF